MPSLTRHLNAIGRCGMLFRARRLADTDIDPAAQPYLFYICRNPGTSQEALGRALYVNKSSVTRHLACLEKKGYLTRTPHPQDKRVLLVYPTERALDTLPHLRDIASSWRTALTQGLSKEEILQFEALLARMLDNAKAALEKEGKE